MMNNSHTLEERLNRLGNELAGRGSLIPRVMTELSDDRPQPPPTRRPGPRFQALTALAVAVCVMVAAALWLARPSTLYARALEALGKARTVHVTGWSSRIVRKWPLEQPQQDALIAKYPVDAWYWREDDGTARSYEKFGPVIQARRGGALREYQQDADLLFIAEGRPKDYIDMFATVAEYLRALDGKGVEKRDLGTRTEDGMTLRGLEIVRHGRTEAFWFDADTDLPIRFSRSQAENDGTNVGFEMRFSYNKPVPMAVVDYAPPKTDNIRYGHGHQNVELAWRRHVQDIGLRLQEEPPDGRVAILPRKGQETFAHQWSLLTPDGRHRVIPLDLDQFSPLTVKNFINLRVATQDGDRAYETWRVAENLLEVELPRRDLIYAEGTPWQEWVQYALNEHGLEYVDVVEPRTYWIARHDGRKLRPWREVDPPVPYIIEGGVEKKGVVKPGVGHQLTPETMHGLFADFNRIQNMKFAADHPVIVDETGLPRRPDWDRDLHPSYEEYREQILEKYFVATDSPWFGGEEARQMARDWFRKEFGVSFTEEQRPTTIHVVRRKQ